MFLLFFRGIYLIEISIKIVLKCYVIYFSLDDLHFLNIIME